MSEFVGDCPNCGAKSVTFTIQSDNPIGQRVYPRAIEAFVVCRICDRSAIALFVARGSYQNNETLDKGSLSNGAGKILPCYDFLDFPRLALAGKVAAPDFLPEAVANCFNEGADAFCIGAYNASASMFRLALDIASKGMLPDTPADQGGPNANQRKRLFDRLKWLFDNKHLPEDLRELADCIREDGNDGAHDGSLKKADAEDLIDFVTALLERVYTEPARLAEAKARRLHRRAVAGQAGGAA